MAALELGRAAVPELEQARVQLEPVQAPAPAPGAATWSRHAGARPVRAPGAAGGNRAPTVRAQCEPCTVETGRQLTSTADAQDADGDTLNYRWTSPTGNFANSTARQTQWTAPTQPGSVPLTVTVDDGRGGTASANVTVQVVQTAAATAAAAGRDMHFEDVHFDFDRYSLRPEATRILDEAVKNLMSDRDAADHHRRPHVQHRHGRIQPCARRTPRRPPSATTSPAEASPPIVCRR